MILCQEKKYCDTGMSIKMLIVRIWRERKRVTVLSALGWKNNTPANKIACTTPAAEINNINGVEMVSNIMVLARLGRLLRKHIFKLSTELVFAYPDILSALGR